MTETMTFGDAVRQLRLAGGMTQPDLAWVAGISKGMVSMVETGRRIPSATMAIKISHAFRMPRHAFLALLSVGGYASQESQQQAALELRAYLNTLDAPGSENLVPPRVERAPTQVSGPLVSQRG